MYRSAPREGAYVHGIFMEGARWDVQQSIISESKLKELYPPMPVINIRVSNHAYLRQKETIFIQSDHHHLNELK